MTETEVQKLIQNVFRTWLNSFSSAVPSHRDLRKTVGLQDRSRISHFA